MEQLETGNIGIGYTSTLATLNSDRIAPMVGRGVSPSRPPNWDSRLPGGGIRPKIPIPNPAGKWYTVRNPERSL